MTAKKGSPLPAPPSRRRNRDESELSRLRDLPVWPEQVVGKFKHVHSLERLIGQLREQDPHGNRDLFLDDVFVAYLLAFFNPAPRTLRTMGVFQPDATSSETPHHRQTLQKHPLRLQQVGRPDLIAADPRSPPARSPKTGAGQGRRTAVGPGPSNTRRRWYLPQSGCRRHLGNWALRQKDRSPARLSCRCQDLAPGADRHPRAR